MSLWLTRWRRCATWPGVRTSRSSPEPCTTTAVFSRFGRHYTGDDGSVPGQFQGPSHDPGVLGENKGNSATRVLRRDPALLSRLAAAWPAPARLIHIIRNPYDNIAPRALRNRAGLKWATRSDFATARAMLSHADAEDAVQNGWIAAYKARAGSRVAAS